MLIGRDLGAPILYEIVTGPGSRRQGVASHLLASSVEVLAARGEPHISAWVTDGNVQSEALLTANGFHPTTAPLTVEAALRLYRCATALGRLEPDPDAAYWIESDDARPTLWAIGGARVATSIRVGQTEVSVSWMPADSDLVPALANATTPLTGAVAHRRAKLDSGQ